MVDIILGGDILSMSSLDISELTGKQHKHVLEDIDKMFIQLEIDGAGFSAEYKDVSGKMNRMYNLDKDNCICLIAGYDAKVRMKIIKRWQDLESRQVKKIPGSYRDALLALADAELEKETLALERDNAIRTKAHISDSKVATALGKVGGLTTANVKLKKKLEMTEFELWKETRENDWVEKEREQKRMYGK